MSHADDRAIGEVFWFWLKGGHRFHAFELCEGELEPLSVCGRAPIDSADDEPARDSRILQGQSCFFCESLVLQNGRASA